MLTNRRISPGTPLKERSNSLVLCIVIARAADSASWLFDTIGQHALRARTPKDHPVETVMKFDVATAESLAG